MLSPRFEQLFGRLTAAFVRYDDIRRSPDRVRDLAAPRLTLDDVRREIAEIRIVEEEWARLVVILRETESGDSDLRTRRVRRSSRN